ncbi:MAG: imidazole glycerol phosphate synthase subunit HisH [Gammaproteobacteria bacterium]|nr:imidazole glycerol phosphate synthase subunit HisH [Gammaproteobacteria bacterium]
MGRVALIDCGSGNLYAVQRALEKVASGAHIFQCFETETLKRADKVVLTGTGNLAPYLEELHRLDLVERLREVAGSKPVLASNLGLLALQDCCAGNGDTRGLGILNGAVTSNGVIEQSPQTIKPHTGWNTLHQEVRHDLWDGIPQESYFYFAHSHYVAPGEGDTVFATTEHGEKFASVIGSENIFGVQFLPENSQRVGLRLLANFVNWEIE